MGGHSKKMAICKLKREISEETEPATALILDFWSAGLWESKFLLLKKKKISQLVAVQHWSDAIKKSELATLYWII